MFDGQRLTSDLGFDLVGVPQGELLLAGGGDQDVAVGLQDAALVGRGVREAHDGAVSLEHGTELTNLHPHMPTTIALSWDDDLIGLYSQIYSVSQNEIRSWFWEVLRMQLRPIAPRWHPNTMFSISCDAVVQQHLVQLSLNLYHVEYINHAAPSH